MMSDTNKDRGTYVSICSYCGKTIYSNDYYENFYGYGLNEYFCSSTCCSKRFEEEPINHSAWKD